MHPLQTVMCYIQVPFKTGLTVCLHSFPLSLFFIIRERERETRVLIVQIINTHYKRFTIEFSQNYESKSCVPNMFWLNEDDGDVGGVLIPCSEQLSYSIYVSKRDSCVQQYLQFKCVQMVHIFLYIYMYIFDECKLINRM